MVLARSARILPCSSSASSAWVTWSRPCASVRKDFGAVGRPLHRPAHFARRPQADDFLGIDEDLGAEAAADVGRDDAQLVLGRHADEGGDHQPRHMRVLAGVPQREVIVAGVVFGQRRARLDGVGHQAVVDEVELGDVLGIGESGVGRFRIAELPLVDGVVGRVLVDLRRPIPGLGRIDHRRQHLVVDLDLLGGVARLRLASRRSRPRPRRRHGSPCSAASAGCGAIFIGEPSLEWIIQPQIRLPILSLASSAPVSTATTPGMALAAAVSMLLILAWACGERTNTARVSPGRVDVVGVLALAGDEADVFLAAHRRADSGRAHGVLLPD